MNEEQRLIAVEKIRDAVKNGKWKHKYNSDFGYWSVCGKLKTCLGEDFSLGRDVIKFLTVEEKLEFLNIWKDREKQNFRQLDREQSEKQVEAMINPPLSWIDKILFYFGYSRVSDKSSTN